MGNSLDEISSAIKKRIEEAKASGEITANKAQVLESWWDEFVRAFESSSAMLMVSAIKKGQKLLGDSKIYKEIIHALGIEVCQSCDGEGRKACPSCGGQGYVRPSLPRDYIGPLVMSSSPCQRCYGRRYEKCPACGGTGIIQRM